MCLIEETHLLRNDPRILLIDDDAHHRALAMTMLVRELPKAPVEEVESAPAFGRALARGGFDLVVAEYGLGWGDGLSVLRSVQETWPEVTVLFFTRVNDRAIAVEAIKAGASDYLVKSPQSYLRLPQAVSDAFKRATAQRRLSRSETWLGHLLDRSKIGVFRSSLDGRLIEANQALLHLLGVETFEEAREHGGIWGATAWHVGLPKLPFRLDGQAQLLRRLDEHGELRREVRLRKADGSTTWVHLTAVLFLDAEGEIVIDGFVEDISDWKSREDGLTGRVDHLARANEELSEFAYVASHELQAPLRMVEQHIGLLTQDSRTKLGADGRASMDFAVEGVRRMQRLIADLLAYSRVNTAGQAFKACDCNRLVDETVRHLGGAVEESDAEIRRDRLPTVLGDPSQLIQVFQNLLTNALKFRADKPTRVRISAEPEGGEWVFSVQDNGIGIEPKQRESVFTIFKRLHPEYSGTGIGLAICKRIVERHGGRIWVDSPPGGGSTFFFTIPRGPDEDTAVTTAAKAVRVPEKRQ